MSNTTVAKCPEDWNPSPKCKTQLSHSTYWLWFISGQIHSSCQKPGLTLDTEINPECELPTRLWACWGQGLCCVPSFCSACFTADAQCMLGTEWNVISVPSVQAVSVSVCPRMSSRWQTQLNFGQESGTLAGRCPGVEYFIGNPVLSSAQGILRKLQDFWKCQPGRMNLSSFPGR